MLVRSRHARTHIILKRIHFGTTRLIRDDMEFVHCSLWHTSLTPQLFFLDSLLYFLCICCVSVTRVCTSTKWPEGSLRNHDVHFCTLTHTPQISFSFCLKFVRLRSHEQSWEWQLCIMQPCWCRETHRDMTNDHYFLLARWCVSIKHLCMNYIHKANERVCVCVENRERERDGAAFCRALGWICNPFFGATSATGAVLWIEGASADSLQIYL